MGFNWDGERGDGSLFDGGSIPRFLQTTICVLSLSYKVWSPIQPVLPGIQTANQKRALSPSPTPLPPPLKHSRCTPVKWHVVHLNPLVIACHLYTLDLPVKPGLHVSSSDTTSDSQISLRARQIFKVWSFPIFVIPFSRYLIYSY